VELRHESYTAHCGGWQWKVAELVSISAYLLIQPPPLGIAPDSVPSPRYYSCFSPLPSVSHLIQSPRRRGGRRAGATEGLGAARVPRRGWAPRGCHGGGLGAARVPRRGAGRRGGATEGAGRRARATVSLLIKSPPLGISYLSSTGLRLASKN